MYGVLQSNYNTKPHQRLVRAALEDYNTYKYKEGALHYCIVIIERGKSENASSYEYLDIFLKGGGRGGAEVKGVGLGGGGGGVGS